MYTYFCLLLFVSFFIIAFGLPLIEGRITYLLAKRHCMSSFVYQIAQRILSWSKGWLRRYENSIKELSLKLTALQTETKNILTDKRLILELIL